MGIFRAAMGATHDLLRGQQLPSLRRRFISAAASRGRFITDREKSMLAIYFSADVENKFHQYLIVGQQYWLGGFIAMVYGSYGRRRYLRCAMLLGTMGG